MNQKPNTRNFGKVFNSHIRTHIITTPVYIIAPIGMEKGKCAYERKGKIGQLMLGITHVILLKTLQYLRSQFLQTKWPVIHDVVVCRHANLPYKVVSIVFSSLYITFSYNFLYSISIIFFNLYHNVLICKH